MHEIALTLLQEAEAPRPSTILQAIWLGLFIVFVFSVFASGFTAKKIENLHAPSYAKAFGATFMKNILGLTALAIFAFYFQAPISLSLAIAAGVVPIIIYKLVFDASWGEATIIWLAALIVEVGVGYLLTVVGS